MATSSKRPSTDSEEGPPLKKQALFIPTLDIGPVTCEEDLDNKVLKVQNRKLGERLRERNRFHVELERKVELLTDKHENDSRLVIRLRRMLSLLRDQLSVLCAPLESPGKRLTNQMIVDIGESPNALEEVFQCLNDNVYQLGEAVSKGVELKEGVDVMSVLRELQERDSERGNHDDELAALETKMEELNTSLADARFDLVKSQSRCEHLELQLTSTMSELTRRPLTSVQPEEKPQEDHLSRATSETKSISDGTSSDETERLMDELSELRDLAESRLSEITALSKQVSVLNAEKEAVSEEKKKPPTKEAILDSAVYKGLQTQYSFAAHEINQLKTCFDEAKQLLMSAKQQHFMCLEEIRGEELKYQAVVRDEMTQLETALLTTQRDYELLKVDYERIMASNEQAGPRARELQVTVDSLQKTVLQVKAEANRYKSRAHKAEQELHTVKAHEAKTPEVPPPAEIPTPQEGSVGGDGEILRKLREEKTLLETELVSLRAASGSDVREKADIIANERKYRNQVEELKKRFEDYRKDYEKRKEHIREEAGRRSKSLSEDNRHLQKELSAKKHEAQALISEMDCTAQAFEDMQEQNIRLLEQIKEKDDANFKLMSERIKSNSVHKLLLQEKGLMTNQLTSLSTETQRLNEMVLTLQDKEKNAEHSTGALEKEASVKNQALEHHKRKAQESIQTSQETALGVQEQLRGLESVRGALTSKQDELEMATQNSRKLTEEIGSLKRRLEKYKSREWATSSDEVLLEEIRTYKVKLNCPCCSTRKKDTVLTKCFHVFCSECIKSRYDSRLRKCPKCGAAFGANDFHKIYLS